jgi:hypothetical protein
VRVDSPTRDLTVLLDGVSEGHAPIERDVDAGRHVFAFEGPGASASRRVFTIAAGETLRITAPAISPPVHDDLWIGAAVSGAIAAAAVIAGVIIVTQMPAAP